MLFGANTRFHHRDLRKLGHPKRHGRIPPVRRRGRISDPSPRTARTRERAWLSGFLPWNPLPSSRLLCEITRLCCGNLPHRSNGHNLNLAAPGRLRSTSKPATEPPIPIGRRGFLRNAPSDSRSAAGSGSQRPAIGEERLMFPVSGPRVVPHAHILTSVRVAPLRKQ